MWERTYVEELHRYGQKLQKSFHNCLQNMDSNSGNKLTFSNSKIKVLSTECDVFEDGVTHWLTAFSLTLAVFTVY